jgi:hypothetical protein
MARAHLYQRDFPFLQFGPIRRKAGPDSIRSVYIENLQNEIARVSRRPYIKFSNDAAACYDRMIPNLANLASRAFGIDPRICRIQGNTLQKAKYKLKTSMRISDAEYHHMDLFPIYGTGQGSGSSPTLWLVTSSVLFDAYETKAHGSKYLSPDRAQSASIYMISFVDDSCCQVLVLHDGPFDEETLIALIRHDAQLWSDLLYVSGGKLALHKCSYHFTWYDFEPSGKPCIRLGKFGGDVRLTTPDGDDNLITHLSADVSYKTLGTR